MTRTYGTGEHEYVVPAGVVRIRVTLKGGDGTHSPGEYAGRWLRVNPGDRFPVHVGGPNGWVQVDELETV